MFQLHWNRKPTWNRELTALNGASLWYLRRHRLNELWQLRWNWASIASRGKTGHMGTRFQKRKRPHDMSQLYTGTNHKPPSKVSVRHWCTHTSWYHGCQPAFSPLSESKIGIFEAVWAFLCRIFRIFGEVTGRMVDCFMRPIRPALLSSKMLINWIPSVLRTETVIVDMLISRLMWVYYQNIPNCCRPDLTYSHDRLPSVTDQLLIMYGILLRQLFLVN